MLTKEVLHVSGLDANLLSISAFNQRGFNFSFSMDGVQIRSNGTLITTGIMRSRMYLLRQLTQHSSATMLKF